MNSPKTLVISLLLSGLCAPAMAQTAPSSAVPGKSGPVVTDVAPAPPEDRASTGAIVLEQSPVKAQREAQAETDRNKPAAATRQLGSGALSPGAVREEPGRPDRPAGGSPPAEGARTR